MRHLWFLRSLYLGFWLIRIKVFGIWGKWKEGFFLGLLGGDDQGRTDFDFVRGDQKEWEDKMIIREL